MTIQDIRVAIAAALDTNLGDGWLVSTETEIEAHLRTVIVGHPNLVHADVMADWSYSLSLPLLVLISEGDDVDTVGELYAAITPGVGSVQAALVTVAGVSVRSVEVRDVGPRAQGASGFLGCEVFLSMQVDV